MIKISIKYSSFLKKNIIINDKFGIDEKYILWRYKENIDKAKKKEKNFLVLIFVMLCWPVTVCYKFLCLRKLKLKKVLEKLDGTSSQ